MKNDCELHSTEFVKVRVNIIPSNSARDPLRRVILTAARFHGENVKRTENVDAHNLEVSHHVAISGNAARNLFRCIL